MRRLRLVVAYDGGSFSGFARQPEQRTVQGDLEVALERLAKRPVATVGAGRTDAGVHARGQVVHADVPARLDPERVRRALNGRLKPEITVREAAWAPPGFDARHSARRRTYVYRIDDSDDPDPLLRGFVLAWPRPLDLPRMREAAGPLVGEHDFAAFCRGRAGATTTRRLRSLGSGGAGGWSRSGWSPTPSAGRWSGGSSATCCWSATAAATRRPRSPCWPRPTAPGPATSPPPTAWSWSR